MDQATIRHMAEDEGFKTMTLRRAKDALNIRSRKSGMGGGWTWELPQNTDVGGQQ
jgi:hypothetical protein